jgi:excisionase family DNA binding protein
VHPATVRNWADRGDLPSRRTPGGHRRFRRSDLQQWLETRQAPPPAEVQMLIQSALGRMRLHISDGEMRHLDWYVRMDDGTRETMRQKGWHMLRYMVEPPDSAEQAEVVRAMGRDYAQFLIGQGLTLSQAMQGYMVFGNFLHEAAMNIIEVVNMRPPTEWLNMLRQVQRFNNALLVGLIQIYEQHKQKAED